MLDSVTPLLAATKGRVSEPGDAGAPVLDDNGKLVAMGYLRSEHASQLLRLKWLFDENDKLKLAQ
jgi:hypothetical protein